MKSSRQSSVKLNSKKYSPSQSLTNTKTSYHSNLHLPVTEIVIQEIISHLIREVIYIKQSQEHINNIPNYCFDFLKQTFKPLLIYHYIPYDEDSNTSNDISLPNSSTFDSLCTSQITVTQDKSIISSHIKELADSSDRKHVHKSSQKKRTFINFNKTRTSIFNNNITPSNNDIRKTQRNIKEISETFPYYDIKDKIDLKDIIKRKELEDIAQLRKEINEQQKKEMNINTNTNMTLKKNYLISLYNNSTTNHTNTNNNTNTNTNTNFTRENKSANRLNKLKVFHAKHLIDNRFYTFDSNGEVIKKTNMKVPIQEGFIEAPTQSKLIKEMINDNYYTFKHPFTKKNKNTKEQQQPQLNENEISKKQKHSDSLYKLILNTMRVTKPKTLSPPSGDNFDLIKPEIGVIITYDDDIKNNNSTKEENAHEIKVKSGGLNFNSKYNRFSIRDYNQIAEMNSKHKTRSQLNTPSNTVDNVIINNNNNKDISNENNSNTFYSVSPLINNDKRKLPLFNNANVNVNNAKTRFQAKLSKSKSTKCISINENVTSNLKYTLDMLDLNKNNEHNAMLSEFPGIYSTLNNNNNNNSSNREDVFKTMRTNIKKNNKFNQTNDFVRFNYNYNYNLNTLTSLKRNNSVNALTPSKAYLNKTQKKNGFIMKVQQSPRVRVGCTKE